MRATPEREEDLEEALTAVERQVNQISEMGLAWIQAGEWSCRQKWTDDEWVAFLRTWSHFLRFLDKLISKEERALTNAFRVCWTFYACAPERPKGDLPDDVTRESASEKVDELLVLFVQRLGDATRTCVVCNKFTLGKKLKRCSRCKCVEYCSVDCQKAHWRHHKKLCVET